LSTVLQERLTGGRGTTWVRPAVQHPPHSRTSASPWSPAGTVGHISIVLQEPFLYGKTLRENIGITAVATSGVGASGVVEDSSILEAAGGNRRRACTRGPDPDP